MDERQKIREELKELGANELHARQGRVPDWEMPAGYLDQLTDQVMESATRPTARYSRMVIMRWAAAAVLVLAAGYWWWQAEPAKPSPVFAELDWNTIPTEDMQQYVSDNIEEFDLDLLANSVGEKTNSEEVISSQPDDAISTEALEEYLEADEEWIDDLTAEDWF